MKERPVDRNMVNRMISALQHRGPDYSAISVTRHIGFGHCRLSIVDLDDHANQPMVDVEGRYRIIFNGEIYNFIELRKELETLGHQFRTHSDTEVILEAYKEWGPSCLDYFNGMWAFVICDDYTGDCFFARDRFGVKPLHYVVERGRLIFASEIKALARAGISLQCNDMMVGRYFRGATTDAADQTMFSNIHSLSAGHWMLVRKGKMRIQKWWDTSEQVVDVPSRYSDRVELFEYLLTDATRIRLRNDVPTAITLSGGMDSSAIYALTHELQDRNIVVEASDNRTKTIQAYSVAQPGQSSDESEYIQACLNHFGQTTNWIKPTPRRFTDEIESVIRQQEAPVDSLSIFGFHSIYRRIAEDSVRVVVEGHGSDEMLAGYPYLVQTALKEFIEQGQWQRAWQAARALSATRNPQLDQKSYSALYMLLNEIPSIRPYMAKARYYRRRLSRRGMTPRFSVASYLAPELIDNELAEHHDLNDSALNENVKRMSLLKQELYKAFHQTIIPSVLRIFDRATMAASVESRMPFMDYRLVSLVFSLPDTDIVARGETKHILRTAMRKYLPRKITGRKRKMGFAVDGPNWFEQSNVRSYLSDLFNSGEFRQQGWVDAPAFLTYFNHCMKNGFAWHDTSQIWKVANMALWQRLFIEQSDKIGDIDDMKAA